MSERKGILAVGYSDTPLRKKHREIADALTRCPRTVDRFDAGAYDIKALTRTREMWRVRMVAEHRSTSVFATLTTQLMEANATLDAKALVVAMAHDELRHAEICADTLRAIGGDPECEAVLDVVPLPIHRGCTPEERAMRNIVYGSCLSETVNAARFVDSLDQMSDPYLRDTTRMLLADEVLHGQFGFYYLETWSDWLARHPEVRRSIAEYMRYAFVVYERALAGAPGPFAAITDDERALGVPDPKRSREVFYLTIEEAVIPGLERFGIEAREAWRTRSMDVTPLAGP